MNNLIEIKKIKKTYKLSKINVDVLREIDLSIERGTKNCIMGSSGCGKSTLLNLIGTMDTPSSGTYFFDNKDVGKMTDYERTALRARDIGFIFQNFNLVTNLTIAKNIALPLVILKYSKKEIQKKTDEIIEKVGLSHRKNHHPNELSGGEKQRVAIARAIIKKSKLIIADEPTGNLDEKTSHEIMELLTTIVDRSDTTLILVTHDREMFSYFNNVYYIRDGIIL